MLMDQASISRSATWDRVVCRNCEVAFAFCNMRNNEFDALKRPSCTALAAQVVSRMIEPFTPPATSIAAIKCGARVGVTYPAELESGDDGPKAAAPYFDPA